jgi:hypothetical protein
MSGGYENRARGTAQQPAFGFVKFCDLCCLDQRRHHDSQRLAATPFSLAESLDGSLRRGIDEQLIAAQSTERNDPPIVNC